MQFSNYSITEANVQTAIALAESRLDTWRNKNEDERAEVLHKVADRMKNKPDMLSAFLMLEIDKLLIHSSN